MGLINLERNSLYAHFSINQHLCIGDNIVQLQRENQENVSRLKSRQVLKIRTGSGMICLVWCLRVPAGLVSSCNLQPVLLPYRKQ